MCTRAALPREASSIQQSLITHNSVQIHGWDDSGEFQPKYNVGDMMRLPIVFHHIERRGPLKKNVDLFKMRSSRWRFVPAYCKVEDETRKTLDVPAEDLVNSQGFGKIARTQKRCAVVCQGYYSFPRSLKELPWYVKREDKHLLLLAGICATAKIDGKELHSFAVVTTKVRDSEKLPGKRRPVILGNSNDMRAWLSQPYWAPSLDTIVTAPHNTKVMPLDSYEVPEGVRQPKVESPSFIEPIAKRPDGLGRRFFGPVEAKEKRPREPADDGDLERQTPPPCASSLRAPPATPSSSKRLRLTSPVPSPRKVPITPSKPIRVTQVNASDSESPSPVEVTSGTSSAGSRSHGNDSDAEMSGVEYVAGSSEDESGDDQVLPTPGNAKAGPSTRKGKEREGKRRGRGIEQSKYFS